MLSRSVFAGVGGGAGARLDEAEQVGEAVVDRDVVQAETVERGQLVLVFGHLPGAEGRPDGGDGGRPRVGLEQGPVLRGDSGQSLPPGLAGGVGAGHARVGGVEHKVQQLGLAGHVGIQRHRHHAERLGHPAHRHRVQALGIGELGGRVHHGVDAQPLPGAVPRDSVDVA